VFKNNLGIEVQALLGCWDHEFSIYPHF